MFLKFAFYDHFSSFVVQRFPRPFCRRVFQHLDIICQTFEKLISTLDSGVFILYHYSLACCFLIHSENRLWSNLTPTYFSQNTKYFVISEVCPYTFTNSIFGEMR